MTKGPSWRVVAVQESRDLWVSGRGPVLLFAYSVLLSVISYLAGTNQVLNFLEQREAVNLTLQVAVTVGVLVTLLVSADAVSGERERGTLESLLLTPMSRRGILVGKLTAALSLWGAAFLVGIPYLWVLGRGVELVGKALVLGVAVGTVLAVALAAFGLLVSAVSNSNKASLAVSFLVLLALFAPAQLPPMPTSWIGDAITRVNPLGSATTYLSAVLVKGHDWTRDLSYLISPVVALLVAGGLLVAVGPRFVRLIGGVNGS
ncbi:MAG TPA: ABC transporter permease subunit [Actinophytocola sp.]|jgi:ABC-2 type transport system permease protein|uniref:ABC transporter permease n=1 Tax=Actinophytocola sp. TaxID=1872138 RepID=UPI002E0B000E|nr:ABC transporter permease subunit [Actinophytocola sp.]